MAVTTDDVLDDEAPSPIQDARASLPSVPSPGGKHQREVSVSDDAPGLFSDDYSALSLIDLAVVVEAHLDLWRRKLNFDDFIKDTRHKAKELQNRAEEASKKFLETADGAAKKAVSFKDVPGLAAVQEQSAKIRLPQQDTLEREVHKFRERLSARASKIQARWDDARLVSLRDKVSFLFGVMNVALTCLMVGLRPHWIPISYSIQACTLLPYRLYNYKKRNWHYFLLDSCYAINLLVLLFIWVAPGSRLLLEAAFALTQGPLLAAVAAWRNSLVFHSLDKVTSLFIHVYPAMTMMIIVHHLPNGTDSYPALKSLDHHLNIWETFLSASVVYLIWQGLYWRFVLIARKAKIEHGGRITSFTYMLNAKHGAIGKALSGIKPENRETAFMIGQFVFTVVTMAPAPWVFSSTWFAGFYLTTIFGFATWNGAAFYIDVYLQKEIKKMRQELDQLKEDAAMRSSSSSLAPTVTSDSPPTQDHEHSGRKSEDLNQVPEISIGESRLPEVDRASQSSGELVDHRDAREPDDSHGHMKAE